MTVVAQDVAGGGDVAVVTGHSQGLGLALAQALLERGWRVYGLSRSRWPAERERGEGALVEVALDLADVQSLLAWLQTGTLTEWLADARRALLVNNAGVVGPIGRAGAVEADEVARAVALNVTAPLLLSNGWLKASAAVTDRRLVHISSGAARHPYVGWSTYCSTKAALDMHARALALEQAAGLRVESLAPGVVDTGMQAQVRQASVEQFAAVQRFKDLHRNGQLAAPADVAERLLGHVLSERFGQQPLRDLREL